MNSDENMLGSFMTHFDHGLLIIDDSDSMAPHETWEPATEYIHLDRDSLYVAVQSVVDGPVTVEVYRDVDNCNISGNLVAAFNGGIDVKSGRLRLHDSDDKMVFMLVGRPSKRRLDVLVDELGLASRVVAIVGEPQSYRG